MSASCCMNRHFMDKHGMVTGWVLDSPRFPVELNTKIDLHSLFTCIAGQWNS